MDSTSQMSKLRLRGGVDTGDITINDFANSQRKGCVRLKKNKKCLLHVLEGDKEQGDPYAVNCGLEEEKQRRKRGEKVQDNAAPSVDEGEDYPMDVWFLLSRYIRPEDVGRFAGICQASCTVVRTANFWISLYRRYYKEDVRVPEHLQPDCMARRYKLRSLVIQYLYHTYKPYNGVNMCERQHIHNHNLVGLACVAFWTKREMAKENQYCYFFRLKEARRPLGRNSPVREKLDLLATLSDVYANDDEGCKLLQVVANCFCPIPMIMHLRLRDYSFKLDRNYAYKQLVLHFGSGPSKYELCTVDIPSVIWARVLDWWEPQYIPSQPPSGSDFSHLNPCLNRPLNWDEDDDDDDMSGSDEGRRVEGDRDGQKSPQ